MIFRAFVARSDEPFIDTPSLNSFRQNKHNIFAILLSILNQETIGSLLIMTEITVCSGRDCIVGDIKNEYVYLTIHVRNVKETIYAHLTEI